MNRYGAGRTKSAIGVEDERFTPFAEMIEKHPERVIEKAVYGMLPKNALARQTIRRKLRVFGGAEHPHTAQQPKVLNLKKSETE